MLVNAYAIAESIEMVKSKPQRSGHLYARNRHFGPTDVSPGEDWPEPHTADTLVHLAVRPSDVAPNHLMAVSIRPVLHVRTEVRVTQEVPRGRLDGLGDHEREPPCLDRQPESPWRNWTG